MPNDDPRYYRARYRALRDIPAEVCAIREIGYCSGPLERHHKNEDPSDNSDENVIVLCRTHHKLVHKGRINLENPRMPRFKVSGGFRRYEGTVAWNALAKAEIFP